MTSGLSTILAGFKVLDFCWIGAGSLVTKTLAELGASVYRVESRTHPDNLRLAPPFRPGKEGIEGSGYFASRNPSKKSVAINMSTDEGRRIAAELALSVDLVASNFRPGIMTKWGLDYDTISAHNPRVLYLTMPMQGATGPHAQYIGFGSTISALSGLVDLTGLVGRAPVGTGTHFPDHLPNPGHTLVALLAAIRHRSRTGEGQHIELSQLESTVNVIGPAVIAASAHQPPERSGNHTGHAAPHGTYRTRDDRWIAVACRTEDHWRRLVTALDSAALAERPEFSSVKNRLSHHVELDAAVGAVTSTFDLHHIAQLLSTAGVPSAVVKNSKEMVEDEALWRREYWQQIDHPYIGEIPLSTSPFRAVGEPRQQLTHPPLLGEHTWEVLSSELSLDRDAYDRLVNQQILY